MGQDDDKARLFTWRHPRPRVQATTAELRSTPAVEPTRPDAAESLGAPWPRGGASEGDRRIALFKAGDVWCACVPCPAAHLHVRRGTDDRSRGKLWTKLAGSFSSAVSARRTAGSAQQCLPPALVPVPRRHMEMERARACPQPVRDNAFAPEVGSSRLIADEVDN